MHIDIYPKFLILLILLSISIPVAAQSVTIDLDSERLPLSDLSHFRNSNSAAWQIAGNVSANRHKPGKCTYSPGKGTLIYTPQGTPSSVTSKLEFGDMDLEFDFLLSRNADFTVTLHDQFQVNMPDAWMKPGFDAFKAAGLWQHAKIRFRDINGSRKIEQVQLNGQDITALEGITHVNQPASNTKAFSITGNTGGFAIRDIRYKTYGPQRVALSDITFKVYNGLHKNPDTLQLLPVKRSGKTDTLSHRVGDRKSQLVFDGIIDVPAAGEYLFKLTAGGGAWFYIDNKLAISNKGSRDFERAFYQKTILKKGKYPFKLVYSNSDECLVLHYQGPHIVWQSLTTPASVRLSEHFEPLEYQVKTKPILQRGFMMQGGKVNPYTAAVGFGANNYAYDMQTYNLMAGWHGRFIDVANMWRERGEKQLEIPLGAKLEFSEKPLLAKLQQAGTIWPDSAQTPDGIFNARSYSLDANQVPVFSYALQDVNVEDKITELQTHEGLSREIKIRNTNKRTQYYILLAEGKYIEKLADGSYAVNDKSYYVEKLTVNNGVAMIRKANGIQQLIVPVATSTSIQTIKYNIVW
jgi:hypothetical protein